MVLRNHTPELFEELIALLLVKLIYVFRKWAKGKDTLPSCNRIRAHYRMHRLQLLAHILRASALRFV